jgi:hypothetical protein
VLAVASPWSRVWTCASWACPSCSGRHAMPPLARVRGGHTSFDLGVKLSTRGGVGLQISFPKVLG